MSTVQANRYTDSSGGVLAPISSVMRNRIINGAMVIDQRNAGASVTPTNAQYLVDRWQATLSAASKFTVQQDAGAVTPPAGFTDYLGATSSSAYSISASDFFTVRQQIEGFNVADLDWGTANAKTVTLSFWVRSSLTGTFGGAISNSAVNRAYPFSYTIPAANTWTQISVTIAGDTTGTWLKTNGTGMIVQWGLGVGSTYSATAGAWAAGLYLSATGATSVVGTNGATWYVTGVQFEVGTQATSFEYRQYQQELALCQRYCQVITSDATATFSRFGMANIFSATQAFVQVPLKTTMRTSPSVTTGTVSNYAIGTTGTVFTCTGLTVNTLGTNANIANLLATVASGFTAGWAGELVTNNNSNTSLQLSAEL